MVGMIVGVPLALFVVIRLVLGMLGYSVPGGIMVSMGAIVPLMLFFLAGGLLEELAYTGYATDLAQSRFSSVYAALIIGLPWAIWHIPSMLMQGRTWAWIAWGVAATVAFRFIYIWLYDSTRQSVAAVIAMHALYNIGRVVFPHAAGVNPLVDHPAVHYGTIVGLTLLLGLVLYCHPRFRRQVAG